MKKLILIFLFFIISVGYAKFHSHSHHSSTTHSTHSTTHSTAHSSNFAHSKSGYHSYSHGTNGYSSARINYYHLPMLYFMATSNNSHYYHHYHVGERKDTIFCADINHKEPATESGVDGWFVLIIVLLVILVVGLTVLNS